MSRFVPASVLRRSARPPPATSSLFSAVVMAFTEVLIESALLVNVVNPGAAGPDTTVSPGVYRAPVRMGVKFTATSPNSPFGTTVAVLPRGMGWSL